MYVLIKSNLIDSCDLTFQKKTFSHKQLVLQVLFSIYGMNILLSFFLSIVNIQKHGEDISVSRQTPKSSSSTVSSDL